VDTGWPNLAVLPYRDRLELFGRYLQQLVMESVGKATVRDDGAEEMGLTVYGTKGTTDQHALFQQLREGSDDAAIALIEVLNDEIGAFHPDLSRSAGDMQSAFLSGTREALEQVDRYCFTVTLERLDEAHLAGLIALWERTVGFLAAFWQINAYHQPGVEAGKLEANRMLALQEQLLAQLENGQELTAEGWAEVIEDANPTDPDPPDAERCFHILRHLAANHRVVTMGSGKNRLFRRKVLL
jgi:glucose-6-phosphate isomerase